MARIRLSLACPKYERTEALATGEVSPEGIDLVYVTPPAAGGVVHGRMLKHLEYDASEMSMAHYIRARAAGRTDLKAIPVFPMRVFFHTHVFVNSQAKIDEPADLKGKRIGVYEYGMTMALWLRGILQHEFDVKPSDIEWIEQRKQNEKVGDSTFTKYPKDVAIREVPDNTDLVTMLFNGKLDAVAGNLGPGRESLDRISEMERAQGKKVQPLFRDQKAEAIRYYKKTGFFPINHMIVIKDEVLKENPWVALSLFDAFQRAKRLSYEKSARFAREVTNYVWLEDLYHQVASIFGNDPFPYGLRENRKILDAMTEYSYEQGLSERKMDLEELFASTTLSL